MIAVFIESDGKRVKKSSLEALAYGADLAKAMQTSCTAVTIGSGMDENLGKYGANKVVHVTGSGLETFSPDQYASAFYTAVKHVGANTAIIASTYSGKSIAPGVAVKMNASCTTNVVALPSLENGFVVRKSCFSNKAFTDVSIHSEQKVIGIVPNSYEVKNFDQSASSETIAHAGSESFCSVVSVDKVQGKVVLTEAELVVSAGRGLKGPENWGMIEELADLLGAATACSKPVSDMDWRPHNEHVGQTGITIKPNLYIAIGISGAIQHLAGVSSSKVICVINTDPEAPFFKAADYGIVGDAFDVVPKLIARAKMLKSN